SGYRSNGLPQGVTECICDDNTCKMNTDESYCIGGECKEHYLCPPSVDSDLNRIGGTCYCGSDVCNHNDHVYCIADTCIARGNADYQDCVDGETIVGQCVCGSAVCKGPNRCENGECVNA
ncbi:MAG: hypothetical protein ACQESG_04390, partial [Nanobdellota archaeon]